MIIGSFVQVYSYFPCLGELFIDSNVYVRLYDEEEEAYDMYSIGELAKRTNISVRTLRY